MTSSIAAIHVAKRDLGLDDDTYRAKLMNIVGKTSTKDMTEAERQKVLTVMRNDGFRPADAKPAGGKLTGPYAKKLQALWIAAWNLGVVSDRRDAALVAFVKRQTGLDAVRFLHHADDARAAIDGLKGWLKREAGVSFGSTNGQEWLASDGAKVAWAQWKMLHPGTDLINRKGFDAEAFRLIDIPNYWLADVTGSQWQVVMNALGERVRAARKGGA